MVWKGKEPCGRSKASPGEAARRPGGEAGPPDHEELADSLAFILRAVGRAGSQRERKAIPLAAAGRAQGKQASLLGLGGPGRVRAPWARAHSRAGFQLPSLPTLSRAPLCSERLPNSDQRPGNLGQHHKGSAHTPHRQGGRGRLVWEGGLARVCSRLMPPRASLSLSLCSPPRLA